MFISHYYKSVLISFSALILIGCGGTGGKKKDTLEVPLDMPAICHDVDFDLNIEMREMCGVKVRNYRAYKNVPQYRMLIRPKGGKIVKKGDKYELRLPKMIPIILPTSLSGKIEFNESSRRTYLQSTWEYYEFFPGDGEERVKIMRIDIPVVGNAKKSVCYTILSRPSKVSKVQTGFASQLEVLECSAFNRLKPEQE